MSNVPHRKPVDPALPKYPLIRAVDVILIGSIVLLGLFVLAVALGRV